MTLAIVLVDGDDVWVYLKVLSGLTFTSLPSKRHPLYMTDIPCDSWCGNKGSLFH